MRHAILSLIEPCADSRTLLGFLSFADGNVIMTQMDLACRFGCRSIICLVEQAPEDLDAVIDYAGRLGLKFALVRSIAELSALLTADDEIILIADGLVLAISDAEIAAIGKGPAILTFCPADSQGELVHGFERMDINHVWAGLALLRGSDVIAVGQLPGDWNVQSAALRVAVQRNHRRIIWPMAMVETGRATHPYRAEDIRAELMLTDPDQPETPLSRNKLYNKALSSLSAILWKKPQIRPALRSLAMILPAAAIGLGWYGWVATGLAALWAGRAMGRLDRRFFRVLQGFVAPGWLVALADVMAALALVVLVWRSAMPDFRLSALFAVLMTLGLWIVLRRTATNGDLAARLQGLLRAALLPGALLASILSMLPGWIMLWSLLALALLLWSGRETVTEPDAAE
ncbi:MAG: hypothetical protein R3E02_05570 [Blastomonas sp.]